MTSLAEQSAKNPSRRPRPGPASSRLRSLRAARTRACQDVLVDGLSGALSLARVHWQVAQQHPLAGDPELQSETIRTIRFLAEAGLVNVGYRAPGGRFVREPLDSAMLEVHDAYVRQYDDPGKWIWCCWLRLTATGQELARARAQGKPVPRRNRP